MKSFYLLVLLLLTTLVATAYPIEELICPDSLPENCYPKIFHPTKEWQPVKEGQEIPGGLHIRINMDSQTKEAKLLDSLDMPESQELQVVSDSTDHDLNSPDLQQKSQQKSYTHKPNAKISKQEKDEFGESVSILQNFVQYPSESLLESVSQALSSLDELSHDIDFGIKVSENHIFAVLLQLAEILPLPKLEASNLSQIEAESIREHSLRIIAAALRNNPIAVQNALKADQKPSYVMNRLLNDLFSTDSSILQKRILGVLMGFIQDSNGANIFRLNDGENKILLLCSKLSADAQIRALRILDELSDKTLLKRSEDGLEEELSQDDINNQIFSILINKLITDPDHNDFKKLFIELVDLKQKSQVKVDSNFLNWLVNEIERRKQNPQLVERDNSDSEHGDSESFDQYMLRVRHTVFGNPMGLRKAMVDEL